MAQRTGQTKSLSEVRQEIAHTRDRLAREVGGLRYELDFPLKFRKSFQRHTGVWVSAVAVLGLIVTGVPRRKKVVVESNRRHTDGETKKKRILEAGLTMTALRLAATLLKPALTRYVTTKLASSMAQRGRRARY